MKTRNILLIGWDDEAHIETPSTAGEEYRLIRAPTIEQSDVILNEYRDIDWNAIFFDMKVAKSAKVQSTPDENIRYFKILNDNLYRRHSPIVVVTDVDQLDLEESILKSKPYDLLRKPYSPSFLKRKIENAKDYSTIIIDDLTKLYARRGFEIHVSQYYDGIINHRRNLPDEVRDKSDIGMCVAYYDLDGFKEINDDLSHQVGDLILAEVGQIFNHVKHHKGDVAARLHGDEFAQLIIAPYETAKKVVLRTCQEINNYNYDRVLSQSLNYKGENKIGISAGICGMINVMSWHEMIQKSDMAMQKAKRVNKRRKSTSATYNQNAIGGYDLLGNLTYYDLDLV